MKKILISLACCLVILIAGRAVLKASVRDYAPFRPTEVIYLGGTLESDQGTTQRQQAVFGTPYLARTSRPKVIFLGASSVMEGFRPQDLSPLTSSVEFHNLAMGDATPSEMLHLWKHIAAAVPPAVAAKSVVVLGVVYPMFRPPSRDLITEEEDRIAPFFWLQGDKWGGNALLNAVKTDMVPLLAANWSARRAIDAALPRLDAVVRGSAPPPLQPKPRNEDEILAVWAQHMGNLGEVPPARVATLMALVDAVRASGFSVVVVNMPLPTWHRTRSPFDHSFQQRLLPLIHSKVEADPHVTFLDWHDRMPDTDFSDSIHPTRDSAKLWSRDLYQDLKRLGVLPD